MRSSLIIAAVVYAGCDRTPEFQRIATGSELQDLSTSLDALRLEFVAHEHEPRLVALLSAT